MAARLGLYRIPMAAAGSCPAGRMGSAGLRQFAALDRHLCFVGIGCSAGGLVGKNN